MIKVVREIVFRPGLKEAKDLVDGAPKPVLREGQQGCRRRRQGQNEAAGATVSVK